MHQICEELYQSLLLEIRHCQKQQLLPTQEIERCFFACEKHWSKLKAMARHFHFRDTADEIHYFKCTQPRFTAEIEYYHLLYHAALFRPPAGDGELRRFWEGELGRLDRFTWEHRDFYLYLKSGATDKDALYFTRKPVPATIGTKHRVYEEEPTLSCSHGYLLSNLLALEKYNVYVLHQMLACS